MAFDKSSPSPLRSWFTGSDHGHCWTAERRPGRSHRQQTRRLISPALFIPLLEERGLIGEVGQWVLESACRQCSAWHAEGRPAIRVAVNVSAQQFYRDGIVSTVRHALRSADLDPQWLELELTESLTLDESETTLRTMEELKAIGVTLSLDDFGTGWSSLSYLRRFPLDRIKIDRSFVRDLTTQSNSAAIVHSILELARSLGLECVAEGVETVEQLSHLQREHCSEFQGFLYSQAIPAEEVSRLLRAREDRGAANTRPKSGTMQAARGPSRCAGDFASEG